MYGRGKDDDARGGGELRGGREFRGKGTVENLGAGGNLADGACDGWIPLRLLQ